MGELGITGAVGRVRGCIGYSGCGGAVSELGVIGAVGTVGRCIGYSGCDGAVSELGVIGAVGTMGGCIVVGSRFVSTIWFTVWFFRAIGLIVCFLSTV